MDINQHGMPVFDKRQKQFWECIKLISWKSYVNWSYGVEIICKYSKFEA